MLSYCVEFTNVLYKIKTNKQTNETNKQMRQFSPKGKDEEFLK